MADYKILVKYVRQERRQEEKGRKIRRIRIKQEEEKKIGRKRKEDKKNKN